jgi:hypothetical protein
VHSYPLDRTPVPNRYLPEADGPDTSMTPFLRTSSEMDETVRRLLRSNSGLTVRYVESMPGLMTHVVACGNSPCGSPLDSWRWCWRCSATYALLAYDVSLREREIGIRLARGCSDVQFWRC